MIVVECCAKIGLGAAKALNCWRPSQALFKLNLASFLSFERRFRMKGSRSKQSG